MTTEKEEITTLQEALRHAEIAEEKLRTFINVYNEVRTPLSLITTSLLALMREDTDPHRRSVYNTMRRNAERILQLVNQMIDVRRLEQGKLPMHMCETDLIGFLNGVLTLFEQQAKAKMIIVDFRHDVPLLPVWIDRIHFDKVIVNILSNAFKFTPVGGFITLRVEHNDSHVSIYIRDTGIGIPEEKIPYIFDRFFLAHLTVEERNIGTGIGLDFSRMLVEQHHGTIEVHNNVDGPGCEFKITLPLGCGHLTDEEMLLEKEDVAHGYPILEEDLHELPIDTDLKDRQRQHLVIAESDPDVLSFLISELQNDYELTTCTNGREGLTAATTSMPDLVISEVTMPEMDGQALCSHLKGHSTTAHIPVILLTSDNMNHDRQELIEADADAYVMRPFDMNILRRIIVNLLHRRQMLKLKYGRNDQLEEMVDEVKVQSPDEKLLERIMGVINRQVDNADLSVDMIADEVGISRVHLNRKMKELTGQTPYDFIRNIRLKQAAKLLAAGGRSIADVTYACGFSSAASFSTVFKKTYGVSPREYMTGKER